MNALDELLNMIRGENRLAVESGDRRNLDGTVTQYAVQLWALPRGVRVYVTRSRGMHSSARVDVVAWHNADTADQAAALILADVRTYGMGDWA